MKKLLSVLFSILLVSTLVFSVTSCKKGEEGEVLDENVTPVTITIEKETDEDDNPISVLTEISLSASAKSYIDNNDLAGLKALFEDEKHATSDAKHFAIEGEEVTFTIPAEVTNVASNAVANLSFITNLVVGDNVKEIEKGAFVGLSGLKTITLPFVGGKVGAVNEAKLFAYIFGTIGTDGLTAVTQNFNEGTESTSSLYVPTSLKKVVITGDVKVTEKTVKYYVNDDNEHVVLGENEEAPEGKTAFEVTTNSYSDSAVQPYAFYGVTTIEEVVFDGAIDHIPDYTFYGCSAIKALSFKDTITSIGKYAYASCVSLRTLTLGAVTICEGAFSGCTSLGQSTETEVGSLDLSAVVSIAKDAFKGCASLNKEKLVLGAHTEESLEDAFDKDFFEEEDA
ncbi:MAG: leucine-rich repeat protein [Clostridia bacterium]|nr:leucine-rich repeat protein [Clostridia bacterium]